MKVFLPVERLLVVAILITVVLYVLFPVVSPSPWPMYSERLLTLGITLLGGWLVCLLLLRLSYIRRMRRGRGARNWGHTLKVFRQLYLSKSRVSFDLRHLHALVLLFVIFLKLKTAWPFVRDGFDRTRVLDGYFLEMERSAFAGSSMAVHVQRLLGDGWAEPLSSVYLSFYGYLFAVICLFVFQRNKRIAEFYSFSFCLTWLIGILLVYIVPTWGPCFFLREFTSSLPETGVSVMQDRLWANQVVLGDLYRQGLQGNRGLFLISGFPSLHIAAVAHSSYFLIHRGRLLGAISLVYLLLTGIATMYFAWHWVLDDIGGLILAYASIVWSRRVLCYR